MESEVYSSQTDGDPFGERRLGPAETLLAALLALLIATAMAWGVVRLIDRFAPTVVEVGNVTELDASRRSGSSGSATDRNYVTRGITRTGDEWSVGAREVYQEATEGDRVTIERSRITSEVVGLSGAGWAWESDTDLVLILAMLGLVVGGLAGLVLFGRLARSAFTGRQLATAMTIGVVGGFAIAGALSFRPLDAAADDSADDGPAAEADADAAPAATTAAPTTLSPTTRPPTTIPQPGQEGLQAAFAAAGSGSDWVQLEYHHESDSGSLDFAVSRPATWVDDAQVGPTGRLSIEFEQPEEEFEEIQFLAESVDVNVWDRHGSSTFDEQVEAVFLGSLPDEHVRFRTTLATTVVVVQADSENGVRRDLVLIDGGSHVLQVESFHGLDDGWLTELVHSIARSVAVGS
jgi:hypothetical protein